MSNLGRLVRNRRKAAGLSRPELARRLGYQNTNRGLRRIDRLEAHGQASGPLWARVREALDLDEEEAAREAERDKDEYEAEWTTWANYPVPISLSVKWFAGFHAGYPLPPEVADDPAMAEGFAREVAKERGLPVCLTVSRRLSVWIDDKGEVFHRQQAEPGVPNGPYMRLS